MDWFLIVIVLDIFWLIIVPYTAYSSLNLWVQADFVYHLAIMMHGIALVLYLQWVPRESSTFKAFWLWEWLRKDYFRFQVRDPHGVLSAHGEQFILAVYPHGVYPAAIDVYFATNPALSRFKAVATSLLFKVPLLKEAAGLAGAIPANRADMLTALSCKDSLVMAPGGLRDTFCDPIVVKRMGFLKIAMHAGVAVVPVWSENENALYTTWFPWPWAQKQALTALLYPFGLCAWGAPWLPFFWKRPAQPMELRIGAPLHPSQYTSEEAMHDAFYAALEKLRAK